MVGVFLQPFFFIINFGTIFNFEIVNHKINFFIFNPLYFMKIVKQIPAFFIAFMFLFSSAVFFFKLMETPPMTGDLATFSNLMSNSGYMAIVKVFEIITAILLIFPKTRALGYVFAMPIVLNILFTEICIAHQPGIGILMVALAAIGLYLNKEKYMPIID